jgi:hypothetical protein
VNETPRADTAAQGADCSASRQLRAALERREGWVGLDQFEVERSPVDLTDDHEITGSDHLRVRIGVIEDDPETVPERLDPRFEAGRAERLREIVGITSAGDPGRAERFPPGAPLAHDLVHSGRCWYNLSEHDADRRGNDNQGTFEEACHKTP